MARAGPAGRGAGGLAHIDADRGWLLTRDAGANLLDQITDPPDPAIWSGLLPLCAVLQLELAGSIAEFLALGVPDSRPTLLGQAYEDLLSRWPAATSTPAAAEIARLIEGPRRHDSRLAHARRVPGPQHPASQRRCGRDRLG
jgi:hypothetical protein